MNLKPINQDVIIQFIPEMEAKDSPIFFRDNPDQQTIQYFKVLAVAEGVTLVKEGDVVMVDWKNMTSPFDHEVNGQTEQLAITDENQIEAIVEYE